MGLISAFAQALALILIIRDIATPVELVEIPVHRLVQSGVEGLGRGPIQCVFQFGEIDRVSMVVSGAIGYESDQRLIPIALAGALLVEEAADGAHDIDVLPFGLPADIVGLARLP